MPSPLAVRGRSALLSVTLAGALGVSVLVAAPAHAAGSVSGQVLKKPVGGTASALADVWVGIYPAEGGGGAVASDTTGADGRYDLTGVPDGVYQVRTYDAPAPYASEWYGDAWTSYEATEVTVAGGALALDDIVLEPAGYIAGQVVGDDGTPVANTTVNIAESATAGGPGIKTDADGRFDTRTSTGFDDEPVDPLVPGDYVLSVYGAEDASGYPYGASELTVDVKAGAPSSAPFSLPRLSTADFTLLGPDGTPLPAAGVTFYTLVDGTWQPPQSGPWMTDDKGVFRLSSRTQKYKIQFHTPAGYTGPEAVAEFWNNAYTLADASVVDLTGPLSHTTRTVQLGAAPTVTAATPTVSGSARTGATLRANPGRWAPTGVTLRYQWRANGTAIRGATGTTLRVTNTYAGKRLSVTVTGSKTGATAVSRTSAATARSIGALTARTPVIAGKAKKGKKLTARTKAWGPGTVRLRYQWLRNGKKIRGATHKTYKLTKRDVRKRLQVKVTGTRVSYATASRLSRKSAKVKR